MSQENIEFKWLDWKNVGGDTLMFRLEDGAQIKLRVVIDRVGIAVKNKNPDGSPIYTVTFSNHITWMPKDKKFYAPSPPSPMQPKRDTGIGIEPTKNE